VEWPPPGPSGGANLPFVSARCALAFAVVAACTEAAPDASVDAPIDTSIDDRGADAAGGADAALDAGMPIAYSTDFDGTESPISEGGAWSHVGLDWTLVDTAGGIAYGTQTGTNGYDDSYAHLSGFPPDHSASAVIYRSPSLDGTCGTHSSPGRPTRIDPATSSNDSPRQR